MEITEELGTRIIKTLRLIRLFNTTDTQLNILGATANFSESKRMQDDLVAELRQLVEQYARLSPSAKLPIFA